MSMLLLYVHNLINQLITSFRCCFTAIMSQTIFKYTEAKYFFYIFHVTNIASDHSTM